jgi:hypothetical protein
LPWLLAARRKKLRHLLLLLKLLLPLRLPPLMPSRLTLLLPLLLLTPPSRLTLLLLLRPLLLLTPPSRLTLLRQNNHQIIFKNRSDGPVFFRPRFLSDRPQPAAATAPGLIGSSSRPFRTRWLCQH